MISSSARLLRGTANALEAYGAKRQIGGGPRDIEAAYDFIANFQYGAIRLAPIQVREEMLALLARLSESPPHSIVELGTAHGGTMFLFTRVARPDATIVTVDVDGGAFGGGYPRTHAPLFRAFARENQSVHLIRGDSHQPRTLARVKSALDGPIDLLFIDADHTYDGVRRDFEMYAPLVKSGGLVVFHDIVDGPPEAVGGVPEFWKEIRSKGGFEEIVADREQGGYGLGVLTQG